MFNEIKILRRLSNNENIIKLYETFEGESTYYLLMELVEGITLYDEIKMRQSKKFKQSEIKTLMR